MIKILFCIIVICIIIIDINIIHDIPKEEEEQYQKDYVERISREEKERETHEFLMSHPEPYNIDNDPVYINYRKEK